MCAAARQRSPKKKKKLTPDEELLSLHAKSTKPLLQLNLVRHGGAFYYRARIRLFFINHIVCICMKCVQVSHHPPIVVGLFVGLFVDFSLCLFLLNLALPYGPIAHPPSFFPFFVHSTTTVDGHRCLSVSYFVSFSPSLLVSLLLPQFSHSFPNLDDSALAHSTHPPIRTSFVPLAPPSFTLTLSLHSKNPHFLKLSLPFSCFALSHPQQPIPSQLTQRIKA